MMDYSPAINFKEVDMVKSVNRDTINEAFFQMREMCRRMEQDGIMYALWAYNAIGRYIDTGRADLDYVRKFVNLEPPEMEYMIGRAVQGTDLSDGGMLKSMNRYLNSRK